MGHFALKRDFKLQAPVVGVDHLVAKARGNHQIGLRQVFL